VQMQQGENMGNLAMMGAGANIGIGNALTGGLGQVAGRYFNQAPTTYPAIGGVGSAYIPGGGQQLF